jgi:hypothetical protein
MRVTFGKEPRFGRVVSAAPLLTAVALLIGACSDDSTGPGREPIIESPRVFTIAPGAAAAVQSAAIRWNHKLPIVSARGFAAGGFGASLAAPPVSSPFDLTYFGGPVVTAATSYNVYVNCDAGPASCWGTNFMTPATFLRDLNRDGFIRLVDEYIGTNARNQFPVEELSIAGVPLSLPNTATIDDVLNIVFSAASFTGAVGYTSIYHVFLPQGTNMCIDETTCYSPDNFDTWVFCAFHGSVDFGPDAHVLFTVEPYQAVDGCQIPGQTPHGVIDATASTLSHELMETITDPDGNAWFNGLFGLEGSDICSALGSNELIGLRQYFIQKEYSNKEHGCTTRD